MENTPKVTYGAEHGVRPYPSLGCNLKCLRYSNLVTPTLGYGLTPYPSGDNGTAGMMINSSFIAKKKPEVSLSVRIYLAKPSGDALEAAYVRKSIRAKYQLPE